MAEDDDLGATILSSRREFAAYLTAMSSPFLALFTAWIWVYYVSSSGGWSGLTKGIFYGGTGLLWLVAVGVLYRRFFTKHRSAATMALRDCKRLQQKVDELNGHAEKLQQKANEHRERAEKLQRKDEERRAREKKQQDEIEARRARNEKLEGFCDQSADEFVRLARRALPGLPEDRYNKMVMAAGLALYTYDLNWLNSYNLEIGKGLLALQDELEFERDRSDRSSPGHLRDLMGMADQCVTDLKACLWWGKETFDFSDQWDAMKKTPPAANVDAAELHTIKRQLSGMVLKLSVFMDDLAKHVSSEKKQSRRDELAKWLGEAHKLVGEHMATLKGQRAALQLYRKHCREQLFKHLEPVRICPMPECLGDGMPAVGDPITIGQAH